MTQLRRLLLPAAVLVAMVVAAHGTGLRAGFIWDDNVYVTENPHLESAAGLKRVWFEVGATKQYDPLVFTTFWIERRLWGLNPLGYHAVNIALHAVAALLLWALLARMRVAGAWLAAAIFGVHPVFVESVAWVAELKNVQSGVFCLLCLIVYFRFRPLEANDDAGRERRWRLYAVALLLFAAALLSKPVVVGLPVVILLVLWWRRRRVQMADLLQTAPMLAMALAAGVMAIHVERVYGSATGAAWQTPWVERLLVAGRALWFYVAKLAWPVPLISVYPRWEMSAAMWRDYLYLLAVVATFAALWLARRRTGSGPLVAALSFTVLVAPLAGVFNVAYHLHSPVADHFQYHAAPALIALFAAGVAALGTRTHGRTLRGALDSGTAGLLLVLGLLSIQHTQVFQSEKVRCLRTLERNPSAWVAMHNLGFELNAEGRTREAVRWYRAALMVRPNYSEAHNNLGVALVSLGEHRQAIEHYREALRLWPDYALAHNNLGTALATVGDLPAAIREYREALRIRPDYAEARRNLGSVLARSGDIGQAIREQQEALRDRPGDAQAHNDLAVSLAAQGALTEAVGEYREALRLKPDYAEASNGLGMALASQGDLRGAIRRFQDAVRVKPDYVEAHNNLGTALASAGETQSAIQEFREALRLSPEYAEARYNLAMALDASGDAEGAITQYREALRLKPDNGNAHNLLGVCLARQGRLNEAIEHFERAVALDPGNRSARDNLARARAMKGQ